MPPSRSVVDACASTRDRLLAQVTSAGSLDDVLMTITEGLNHPLLALDRVSLAVLPTQVTFAGIHYIWRAVEPGRVETLRRPRGFFLDEEHVASPLNEVLRTRRPLRAELHDGAVRARFQFLADAFAQGMTDYLAIPLLTRRGAVHVLTIATRRDGGWREPLEEALALFAPASGWWSRPSRSKSCCARRRRCCARSTTGSETTCRSCPTCSA